MCPKKTSDPAIPSEPRAGISWFYDRSKAGLYKYFIRCFLPAGKSEQKEAKSRGKLGKDTSTYLFKHEIEESGKRQGRKEKAIP